MLVSVSLPSFPATDNPLVDGETGTVHCGGNFQAMAVTNAMEKTRLGLHHLGKLIFAQCAELINPTMNRGLPPSLAATDPSLNYHAKGIDIASAAYVSELGYLANPVSTHIQSAEMHNQAVKYVYFLCNFVLSSQLSIQLPCANIRSCYNQLSRSSVYVDCFISLRFMPRYGYFLRF